MLNRPHVVEKIRQIQEHGGTGILSLGQQDEVITVYFRDGLISAVSTNIPEHQLGQYITRRGFAEEEQVHRLIEEARRRHIRLGEVAVARKVLDGTDVEDVVREQAIQVLTHALKTDFEVRSFTPSPQTFAMPARIDLSHLMLELARTSFTPFKLEPNRLLGLRNGTTLSHLPWYPQELSVLSELKHPQTIQDLAAATGLEYSRLGRILSVLDTLQLIAFMDEPASETMAIVKRERFPFESLVPEIRKTDVHEKLETFRDDTSFISEQFKTLKVRIAEASQNRAVKVITMSSADTQDGKSLIGANLAVSCSKDTGRRVIVVDCDLRNPTLHKYLGASLEPGLLGYLEGDYLQPYCYMRRLEKLYVMTAGGIASNPVEMLSLDKMRHLIAYLKSEFDTIILDSPPLAPIPDAQILTGLSDGLVVVVRCARTSYSSIERGFKNLDRGKLLGVVFNDVQPRMFNTQYDYRYYHYKYRGKYPYGKKTKSRTRAKNYLDL